MTLDISMGFGSDAGDEERGVYLVGSRTKIKNKNRVLD